MVINLPKGQVRGGRRCVGGEEPGERVRQERGALRGDPGGHLQGRRPRRDSGMYCQTSETYVQGDWTGCCTGNGEKLSNSQAEPGQAIT